MILAKNDKIISEENYIVKNVHSYLTVSYMDLILNAVKFPTTTQ